MDDSKRGISSTFLLDSIKKLLSSSAREVTTAHLPSEHAPSHLSILWRTLGSQVLSSHGAIQRRDILIKSKIKTYPFLDLAVWKLEVMNAINHGPWRHQKPLFPFHGLLPLVSNSLTSAEVYNIWTNGILLFLLLNYVLILMVKGRRHSTASAWN